MGEAEAHWHSTYYLNWLNVAVSNLPDTYSADATYTKRVCRRPISNMTQSLFWGLSGEIEERKPGT